MTRSTVAALLLTLMFWFGIWVVGAAERSLLMVKTMQEKGVDFSGQVQVDNNQNKPKEIGKTEGAASSPPADQRQTDEARASKESAATAIKIAHGIAYGLKTVLPKTSETIELLDRSLVTAAELPKQPGGPEIQRIHAAEQETLDILRGRSIAWVLGTSLGFEAVVLCFAAFIFCRRDY